MIERDFDMPFLWWCPQEGRFRWFEWMFGENAKCKWCGYMIFIDKGRKK